MATKTSVVVTPTGGDVASVSVREARPHGKRHRWGFKEEKEGSHFARAIDSENHDIMCFDCGLSIPGPVYLDLVKKLTPYRNLSIADYMEHQNQLLEITALGYEPSETDGQELT